MDEINVVAEAVKFMVLGMGIVFTFLVIMVYAMQLQAKIIEKYFANKETSQDSTKQWQPTQSKKDEDEEKTLTAAITAAIMHHNYLKIKGE